MDSSIDLVAGHTIDGVTFRIDHQLGAQQWRVGDGGATRFHCATEDNPEHLGIAAIKTAMEVRPGAREDRLITITVASNLDDRLRQILEGVEQKLEEERSGTLARGVVFREDPTLGKGHWRVDSEPPRIYHHGRGVGPHPKSERQFCIEAIVSEVIDDGQRCFSVAPDLYPLTPEVMDELGRHKALEPPYESSSDALPLLTTDRPEWSGKIKDCKVITASQNWGKGVWAVDGKRHEGITPVLLVHAIHARAKQIYVPARWGPILTALAEAPQDSDLYSEAAELKGDVPDALDAEQPRVASAPDDKLYVETTLGDVEEIIRESAELVTPKVGATGRLVEAMIEAAKSHREGWREMPVITRRQPGEPELREPFDEGLSTTDALALWRHLASRLYEVDLEHCLRYGKRGEPSFYRLRVRLRQLGFEDLQTILTFAGSYGARLGWHVKSAAEPVIELT